MSMSNKKIDVLRRLFLGPLYSECKDNPMGVSRDKLEDRLNHLIDQGCELNCGIDEIVNVCQLKSHYPTCIGNKRECIETVGEKSKGVENAYYQAYKRSKLIEDESDSESESDTDDEDTNCFCYEEKEDEPVKKLSCGHYSHISCLIRLAQELGKDFAECPECKKRFSLEEVPVPVRTERQMQEDRYRRTLFNASQMGTNLFGQSNRDDSSSLQIENTQNDESRRRANSLTTEIKESVLKLLEKKVKV